MNLSLSSNVFFTLKKKICSDFLIKKIEHLNFSIYLNFPYQFRGMCRILFLQEVHCGHTVSMATGLQ